MASIKVGDVVMVIAEDNDHPFEVGDLVKVISIHPLGIVYGKNQDGQVGYLIPIEYTQQKTPIKPFKPEQLELEFFD